MKKKQRTLVTLFLVVLFAMPVLFGVNQKIILDNAGLALEKREPAPLPDVRQTGFSAWPNAMEEYFRDHLPLRHQIIRLNAALDYKLFGSTTSRKITLGKEGWLFFKDHDTINNLADYQGILPLDEALVQQTAAALQAIGTQQTAAGRTTLLFMPPNKETVYGEYLPDGIPQLNAVSRCDQLYAQLAGQTGTVLLVDPKPLLMQIARQDKTLYYKTDTHWNIRGAYAGLQPLLDALQVDYIPYDPADFASAGSISGDLSALGALDLPVEQDAVRLWPAGLTVNVASVEGETVTYHSSAADPRRVLVLGDSFRYAMEDVLPCFFAEVIFVPLQQSAAATIEAYDPDVVILQQVERNLDTLPYYLNNLIG